MIKRKLKTCKGCNTEQYLFSKGYCNRCYALNKAREKASEPRSPSSGYKIPPRTKKPPKPNIYGFKNQLELFEYVWDNRAIAKDGRTYCPFTGKRIDHLNGTDRFLSCFAHVIPKGLYPYFKLNPDNIRLVHPDFHYCVDNFTNDMLDDYPDWDFVSWFDLVDQKKEEYKIISK